MYIYPDMERLDYFESLIDRFLQGNNPNSLIYVERTWGNYRKYPKTKSLWKHEDIAAQIGSYIRSNKLDITPKKLCDTLLPENENKRISEKTARRWLKGLEIIPKRPQLVIYLVAELFKISLSCVFEDRQ
ncbi:16637_t:CDS:2 [Entrophospora sp. SA101]|nr:16637_t:CDS:2 [Entrophospora sp. SA101]